MAKIQIRYTLSAAGRAAALAAGVNAGETQILFLQSPDHVENPTPGLTGALPADAPVTLVEAANNLIAQVALLLSAQATSGTSTEKATSEVWAAAVALASIDNDGEALIEVGGFDGSVTGYAIGESATGMFVQPRYRPVSFDKPMLAADLLQFEKAHREHVNLEREQVRVRVQELNEAARVEQQQERAELALVRAREFLAENTAYLHLPEVARLATMTDGMAIADGDLIPYACRAVENERERIKTVARDEWIRTHGSDYLRRLLDAGQPVGDLYQTERLAVERPGWSFGATSYGSTMSPPTVAELDLLDEARKIEPEAQLAIFWRPGADKVWRPKATFMSRSIAFKL